MEILKELKDISLQITEPEYRAMPELSYSNLSTYETLGYNGLDHLFDKKESPSLTLGSCVDAILTGGEDEFNSLFLVADIPALGDKEKQVADYLFDSCGQGYSTMTFQLLISSMLPIPLSSRRTGRMRQESRY